MSTIRATYVQHGSSPVPNITLDASGNVTVASGLTFNSSLSIPSGSVGAPGLSFVSDTDTGFYSATPNTVTIATSGTAAVTVDASQRVGINTTSPGELLHIQAANDTGGVALRLQNSSDVGNTTPFIDILARHRSNNADGGKIRFGRDDAYTATASTMDSNIQFWTAVNNTDTERARIDSSGRLLVGTSTARNVGYPVTFNSLFESTEYGGLAVVTNNNGQDGSYISLAKTRGTAVGSSTIVQNDDILGRILFSGADGTDVETRGAAIECRVDGTPGANDMPGRLVFSTTADGASSPTERMRITSDSNILIGKTTTDSNTAGARIISAGANAGYSEWVRDGNNVMYINRITDDGDLVRFAQADTTEGSISVSGTTVSYNGAHLSRWSQLPGGAERTEILRGSVLSNIDEMCEWGDEGNEQLNRMKVSDVEGDKNVSGVFQAWDDDDDTYTNDFYCAMTGDFVIRIAAGVTVERGDLLISAGDGTAKPQDDDIIRSKTIAKVTSTNVSCTYEDGSYCVPCVLMAC